MRPGGLGGWFRSKSRFRRSSRDCAEQWRHHLMANLLIIDDEPELLREKVCQVFPSPEHRVESAYTGADGIECVLDASPDVVLLDMRLPDLTGLDVFAKIRKIDGRIPVVFVTSARSADTAIEAMRQGAYDYLLKPLDLQVLDRVVNEA